MGTNSSRVLLTADAMYCSMLDDVSRAGRRRQSGNPSSPMQKQTLEAEPGMTYILARPRSNLVSCRDVDVRWAAANLLHFFADTEDASTLVRYNRHAERFAPGGQWKGAYGAIAMPQIRRCINILGEDPESRRAIVSMGEIGENDINRPACWSFLHFLYSENELDLLVYQRSLNLPGVMPYDCVLLSSILVYVATMLSLPIGSLRWTVGSLHATTPLPSVKLANARPGNLLLPTSLLCNSALCLRTLVEGSIDELHEVPNRA